MVIINFQSQFYTVSSSQISHKIDEILQPFTAANCQFFFLANGKIISSGNFFNLKENQIIHIKGKLKGGKGGFGAKLKTQGGKKVRPNDNMFSRDMLGRRISYNLIQKEYIEYSKKKNQEDQQVKRQRQQFKLMENTLKQQHAFMKLDKKYNMQLAQTQRNLQESINMGKQKFFAKLRTNNHLNILQKKQSPSEEEKVYEVECQKNEQNNKIKKRQQNVLCKQKNEQQQALRSEPTKKIKVQSFSSAKSYLKGLFKK